MIQLSSNRQTKEIPWLHVLRAMACLMVVMLHSLPTGGEFVLTPFNEHFRNVVVLLTKPCVPLFFMMTGFLILPYQYQDFRDFYKKRIPRVLWPLMFWGAIYSILPYILGLCNWQVMLSELVLSPVKAPSLIGGILWYVFILIGIYLFTTVHENPLTFL